MSGFIKHDSAMLRKAANPASLVDTQDSQNRERRGPSCHNTVRLEEFHL
jgi:hypothetical protein